MELHYLWVKEFGCLIEESINLSAKYIFRLIRAPRTTPILAIDFNPDFIPGFFGKTEITNVTAIIGQNGTGKTTILNYIKSRLPKGMLATVNGDIVAYTIDGGKKGIVHVPYDFELELRDSTGVFELLRYDVLSEHEETLNVQNKLASTEYIYYSFFLDYQTEPFGYGGFTNISTTAMIMRPWQKSPVSNAPNAPREISDLENLMADEVARAIQLLVSERHLELPFDRPEELSIEYLKEDQLQLEMNDKVSPVPFELKKFINKLGKLNGKGLPKERILNQFYLSLLANFVRMEAEFVKRSIIFPDDIPDSVSISWTVREFFKRYAKWQDTTGDWLSERLSSILALIESFDELSRRSVLIPANYKVDGIERYYLKFPLSKEHEKDFRYFMQLYLRAKGFTPFLTFRWRGLSTGQQSYLSFFSMIYDVRFHQSNPPKGNVVLLIDEGDAGFHPEWQRQFFKATIEFIADVFKGQTVQLLFTSNTPFLTSDLTNPHVIFIEQRGKGEKILIHAHDETRSNTFGANIHELFSNSFYMKGVLIGEFAKDRINEVIKYLNNKKETEKNPAYLKLIELIGEPVLRKKLLSMWMAKFEEDEEQLLRKRLEEIRLAKQTKGEQQ